MLELTRPARMDELTVRIERHEFADATEANAARVMLIERIKDRIGSSVNVLVVAPGTLERSTGKHKRVYDLR